MVHCDRYDTLVTKTKNKKNFFTMHARYRISARKTLTTTPKHIVEHAVVHGAPLLIVEVAVAADNVWAPRSVIYVDVDLGLDLVVYARRLQRGVCWCLRPQNENVHERKHDHETKHHQTSVLIK